MIIFKALVSSFKTRPPTANLTKKSAFKKLASYILWMWISFVFMIHFKLMYSNVSWLQIVIILSCSRDMKWQFGAFNAFLWPNARHEPWELQHHQMKSNKRSHTGVMLVEGGANKGPFWWCISLEMLLLNRLLDLILTISIKIEEKQWNKNIWICKG